MNIALPKVLFPSCRSAGASGPSLAVDGALYWADPREGNFNNLISNGYTTTLVGSPTIDANGIDTDKAGLVLDGSTQRVDVDVSGSPGPFEGTYKEFTFSGIFKGGARGDAYFSLMDSSSSSQNQAGYCIWKGTADTFRNHRGGTIVEAGTPTTAVVHMVWKYYDDSGTFKLDMFQDGVKVINGTNSNSGGSYTIDCFSVGALCDSTPSNYWDGAVGEVILYDSALSDSDIADIYAKAQTDWGV